MGRKRVNVSDDKAYLLTKSSILITRETNQTFFEIGTEITTDIAESVSIMMKNKSIDSNIWNYKIEHYNTNINPENCLYWLTGGHREWKTLDNYNDYWINVNHLFVSKYGRIIRKIVRNSITLGDIRDKFIQLIPISDIYEFSLENNLIK